jgi:hypothetical protein
MFSPFHNERRVSPQKLNRCRICHASPTTGVFTGRLWRDCHSSMMPLLVGLAHITGLRLKSVGGREQVSLSSALSSRPDCLSGVKPIR